MLADIPTWIKLLTGFFAFYAVLAILDARFKQPLTTFGSGRWMSIFEADWYGLFRRRGGFLAGEWIDGLWLRLPFTHSITFGPTGSGKGVAAIIHQAIEECRLLIVDPGGENTAICIKDWRAKGLATWIINPFGMHRHQPWALPQHGFNPLALIDPDSSTFEADARLLASLLFTRQAKEGATAEHFANAAVAMVTAMIMHIVTAVAPARRNIGTLFYFLNADAASWAKLVAAMKANAAADGAIQAEANTMERREHQSPEEHSGVISTAQVQLSWLSDRNMRDLLSRSDVRFDDLRDLLVPGCVISVILPLEYQRSHAAITRLALACAVLALQRSGEGGGPSPLFILDEMAALGRLAEMETWLVTLRKYGVRFWTIFQDIAQLKSIYGQSWHTFMANCDIRQFLGCGDLDTAQFLRESLGLSTIVTESRNHQGQVTRSHGHRNLMTTEELLQFPEHEQIILYRNFAPIRLMRSPFWQRPALRGRLNRNPFRQGETKIRRRPIAFMVAAITRTVLFFVTPHPVMRWVYGASLAAAAAGLFLMFK